MPFSEVDRQIEREMGNFVTDLAIGGSLLMSAGFRNLFDSELIFNTIFVLSLN